MRELRAVLLGSSGLIGSQVLNLFRETGLPVLAVDRRPKSGEARDDQLAGSIDDHGFLRGVIGPGGDVFHFANSAFPGSPDEWGDGFRSLRTLKELCLLCARQNGRLIFPSSGGTVYGEALNVPVGEKHPLDPISTYGLFKKMSEELIQYFGRTIGLRYVILRISNCYGPSFHPGRPQGIIGVALQSVIAGRPVRLFGAGLQIRDFVHAMDIAVLCRKIHLSNEGDTVINAGTGRGTAIRDAVEMVASSLKRPVTIEYAPERPFDVKTNILDASKASGLFGWDPAITIEDGVKEICGRF